MPKTESANKPMWTLESALVLVKQLKEPLKEIGYAPALAGSILTNGTSEHDLDLIIFPLDTTTQNYTKLCETLVNNNLELMTSLSKVRNYWARKGSHDQKHVEIWKDKDGRRIDIFLLS